MTEVSQDLTEQRKAAYLKRFISEYIIPFRFLNHGRLTKLAKCIGLIGPRGSCKSLSASAMNIIDYMVPGYNVISNMEIAWGLHIGGLDAIYQSEKLDKAAVTNFDIEDKTVLMVDEVNLEFSEARRSMTNRALIFNKILQQLRKRKINLIYTVQHEMWIDSRLRWQTDFFIRTKDVCLQPGGLYLPYDFGEWAAWTIFDMSGYLGQGAFADTQRPVIENWRFHGKPWWNSYNTDQIQGIEDEPATADGIKLKRAEYIVQEENNLAIIQDTIMDLHNQGISTIETAKLYEILGIHDHKGKTYLGKILKELGVQYQDWTGCYKIPDIDLDKPETMKIPKEVLVSRQV